MFTLQAWYGAVDGLIEHLSNGFDVFVILPFRLRKKRSVS
jgi:hypothetical protein